MLDLRKIAAKCMRMHENSCGCKGCVISLHNLAPTKVSKNLIETRFVAYGPLYVKKPPKYWSSLGESFTKARNATTGAPMF